MYEKNVEIFWVLIPLKKYQNMSGCGTAECTLLL